MDDILIFAKSLTTINAVKAELHKEYKMKDIGRASFILGIRIRRDVKGKVLILDQSTYIRKFLRDFNMKNSHSVSILIDAYHVLTPSGSSDELTNQIEYQKRIGSLMYAMIGVTVRPCVVRTAAPTANIAGVPVIVE